MKLRCKQIPGFLILMALLYPPPGFSQQKEETAQPQPEEVISRTISLDIKGMDVIDVLKILADEGGFNLSISGNVKGKVNLFLKDIDVWDALEIVLISGNLAYEKKGEIISIMREMDYELKYGRKYWDKREIKVFNLKYARVSRVRELFTKVISKIGKVIVDEPTNTLVIIDVPAKAVQISEIIAKIDKPIVTRIFELNYLLVEDVKENVREILTVDVGTLKIDETTNKLIVTDYPEKLERIAQMVRVFDEKPLQVLIDALIIEIKPFRKFHAGINWDYWIRKNFRITETFAFPASSTDKLSIGTTATTITKKGDYTGTLEFLQTFGETRILSSPRIVTLNNQEAKILVGTKDVYITSTISQSTGTSVSAQTVEFVDVGVKLFVTPRINKLGYITLKIKPEISSSTRETITTADKKTQVPIVTTSEAETTVIVKDGVSIIIGGLRKITREKERKQIPVLGSIPVLGALFRSRKEEWSKNELVIILTPWIVSGDKSIEMELWEKIEGNMGEEDALGELQKEGIKDFGFPGAQESINDVLSHQENLGFPGFEAKPRLLEERISLPRRQSLQKDGFEEKDEDTHLYPPGYDRKDENIYDQQEGKVREQRDDRGEITEKAASPGRERYDYNLQIIEKIRKTAALFFTPDEFIAGQNAGRKGEVKLRFAVSRDGELLEEPDVVFSPGKDLDEMARKIIKEASPFQPFPEFKKKEKKIFEILLVF